MELLQTINSWVWGAPLLILLMGTGLLLTVRLGLIQVLQLPRALKLIFSARSQGEGDISSFGALCTALAATVGTGNIVGVATAVQMGGPGALFWMWVAAFFGMATKYAECLLAVRFRGVDAAGQIAGGPMHYIEKGMGPRWKPLAVAFAFFGVGVAWFGIGTFAQVNAITDSVSLSMGISPVWTGIVLTILVAAITLGGLKSIAKVAEKVVPFMAVFYVVLCGFILWSHASELPEAIRLVITSAFSPSAASGGFVGATVMMAIRSGIARGIFSNESGLGSAPIAAAAAKTRWSAEQGLVSMTGTFIDTLVICSMTGLMLVVTGAWKSNSVGAGMTQLAAGSVFPTWGPLLLTIGLVLFAFTTILGWNYYGERCMEYLVGIKGIIPYRVIFIGLVAAGPFLKLDMIWVLADIVNGLMAFPNLIALLALSGVVVDETKIYFAAVAEENEEWAQDTNEI
ncbi:MAG: sodium:alanine symporter family protein [Negativicutes bacterium]|nr:sodium:alanine symporter family protein [Negativicutes bacterium]